MSYSEPPNSDRAERVSLAVKSYSENYNGDLVTDENWIELVGDMIADLLHATTAKCGVDGAATVYRCGLTHYSEEMLEANIEIATEAFAP